MQKNYEYKSIRISSSDGCLVLDKLIDLSLNKESEEGWRLFTIFPHSCSNSKSCVVIVFERETRA
ncbi:MAG: DUF4177 domain-containing protein [Peptococcales bacterium]